MRKKEFPHLLTKIWQCGLTLGLHARELKNTDGDEWEVSKRRTRQEQLYVRRSGKGTELQFIVISKHEEIICVSSYKTFVFLHIQCPLPSYCMTS